MEDVLDFVNSRFGWELQEAVNEFNDEQASFRDAKILVVDDEPLMLEIIQAFLKEEGYRHLSGISDPHQAIQEILRERPDLVLLDLQMPELNGIDVLRAIRIHPELGRTPVVVLTAATDEEIKLQALKHGANDFLTKPISDRELVVRVKNIVLAKAREDHLQSIEREKRIVAERELSAADEIQSQLYPRRSPQKRGIDVAGAAYSACKGCGDYFDFFTLPNENLALVVGDVSGHGMASALRMVEARAYLHSLAKFQVDPSGILTELNQFMISEAAYGEDGEGQFITMFFASIDLELRTMSYASAGHSAYLLRQGGETVQFTGTGLPLGVADLPIDPSELVRLEPGDKLLIPTDGIEEAMSESGEQFGAERMLNVIRHHAYQKSAELIETLYQSVQRFTKGTAQRDDITSILAAFRAPNPLGDSDLWS
ncbi:MAG: SpoIIE family protein phosphatase [Planctomycetaceae bacterium]|nr:SpoIIE family protein phosphatase [Planctomycetaceae bacterium]